MIDWLKHICILQPYSSYSYMIYRVLTGAGNPCKCLNYNMVFSVFGKRLNFEQSAWSFKHWHCYCIISMTSGSTLFFHHPCVCIPEIYMYTYNLPNLLGADKTENPPWKCLKVLEFDFGQVQEPWNLMYFLLILIRNDR